MGDMVAPAPHLQDEMAEEEFAYPNAPIVEALIDFRVVPRDDISVQDLTVITERLAADYPTIEQRQQAVAPFEMGQAQPSLLKLVPVGYLGRSEKNDWVYQAQINGFSMSRLTPYTRWSDLKHEAGRIWDLYAEITKPKFINRVGLRYINRFDIPQPRIELDEYFRTTVSISEDIVGDITTFYMQAQVPQPDIGCLCVINSTALPRQNENTTSILLDLDLFTNQPVEFRADQAWELLEEMRKRKNRIFEASITNRTRELFK